MPYNANQEWEVEDDSVAKRLPGLMATGSPLMTKARGDAMRTANRRGLQNSSIAAGEGTKAALGVVTPIAMKDAETTAQKNLAAQGFGYNTKLEGQRIAGQKEIVGMQETGADRRHGAELTSREKLTGMEIGSREGIAREDRTARSSDLGRELTSREGIVGRELTSRETIAREDRTARSGDLGRELTSRETIARDDRTARSGDLTRELTSRETVAGADRTSRETIARDDRAASRSTQITNAISHANTTYTNYVNGILANENIPIAERNKLIVDAGARRDAEIEFIETVFGINLGDWNKSTPNTDAQPTLPDNNNDDFQG